MKYQYCWILSELPDILERRDCIARNVPGDGNCLFHALSVFEGTETEQFMSNARRLRNELMDYLLLHQNDEMGNGSGFTVRDWMCTNLDEIIEQRKIVIRELNADPRRKRHVEESKDRVLQHLESTIPRVEQYALAMRCEVPGDCEWGTGLEIYAYAHLKHLNVKAYLGDPSDGSERAYTHFEGFNDTSQIVDEDAPTLCIVNNFDHFQALLPREVSRQSYEAIREKELDKESSTWESDLSDEDYSPRDRAKLAEAIAAVEKMANSFEERLVRPVKMARCDPIVDPNRVQNPYKRCPFIDDMAHEVGEASGDEGKDELFSFVVDTGSEESMSVELCDEDESLSVGDKESMSVELCDEDALPFVRDKESMSVASYYGDESLSVGNMERGGTDEGGGEEDVSDIERAEDKRHSNGLLTEDIHRGKCKVWQDMHRSKMSCDEKELLLCQRKACASELPSIEKDERRERQRDANKRHALGLDSEQRSERRRLRREGMQKSRNREKEEGCTSPGIGGEQCSNCQRRPILSKVEGYRLVLTSVTSKEVRNTKLAMVKCHSGTKSIEEYTLCAECMRFLWKPAWDGMSKKEKKYAMQWENIWPAFFCNLLLGKQADKNTLHREVYEASFLWRWIPTSIRGYWIDAIHENGSGDYSECTLNDPPSFFVDRTEDIVGFDCDMHSFNLARFMNALDFERQKAIMITDVLCPWGCTEFCFQARPFDFCLFVQHHLRKVVVNLPSSEWYQRLRYVESSRKDYIRCAGDYDYLLLKDSWPIMPSVAFVPGKGLMLLVCRYHEKYIDTEKLYLHLPRKPYHNLSAVQPDQLSHCSLQPRTIKGMHLGSYNTTWRLNLQVASFSGVDSMTVANEGKFVSHSSLLLDHEMLSLQYRDDISHLLSRYVVEGIVNENYANELRKRTAQFYPPGCADDLIQGATYIGLADSMIYQKEFSHDCRIDAVVLKKNAETDKMEEVKVSCHRSWARTINALQMEDVSGYGYPFKPVKKYGLKKNSLVRPIMMMWTLAGSIMGCKELWQAIDNKRGSFWHNGWEGHLMTHFHHTYLNYANAKYSIISPFKSHKNSTNEHVLTRLLPFVPTEMQSYGGTSDDNPSNFFMFGIDFWRALFPRDVFETISIHSSVDDFVSNASLMANRSNVVIVVETEAPFSYSRDHYCIGGFEYELRSVMFLQPRHKKNKKKESGIEVTATATGHFKGIRFVRHGSGFNSWWKQTRSHSSPLLMMQTDEDDPANIVYDYCFARVLVYVRLQNEDIEQDRLDLFESIGGQMCVFCRCNNFPLIVSRGKKRNCMSDGCHKKEAFMCCNLSCNTRICKSCFNEKVKGNKDSVKYCEPMSETVHDGQQLQEESIHEPSTHSDLSLESSTHSDSTSSDNGEENDDAAKYINEVSLRDRIAEQQSNAREMAKELIGDVNERNDDFFLQHSLTDADYNPIDETFNEGTDPNTSNDYDSDDEFVPVVSSAGQMAYTSVSRGKSRSVVPFHVLLNQAGSVCKRYNQRITGTQEQQNFVQRLVSTVTGTSIPLMYPEATCFPRHFYAQATHDSHAILGAMPLSCFTSNPAYPHGIASTLSNARLHMTHSSSSTSTCHSMLGFDYDEQCNKVAGSVDSRLINRNGFVVDQMSKDGISLRDGKRTDLNHGVDSHQAALDLAATQLWERMDWFLTFTCNQALHPGIKHLYLHKESLDWTKFIPGYDFMCEADQDEIKLSFENAYGILLSRCWMEVSKLLLNLITHNDEILGGPVENAFWRYEYQEGAANLFHIHGLIGLMKNFMEDPIRRKFVFDLQKCDIANLVATEDIEQFVKEGLLESLEEVRDIQDLGFSILRHVKHTHRCLERVKDTKEVITNVDRGIQIGKTPFRCRHIDIARESKDFFEHEFKPFKFEFPESCLSVLADCGLYEWPTAANPRGIFHNRLFTPNRHFGRIMPYCKDKMSPVISRLFVALKGMMNAQILTNTNGVARYVVKYVTDLDNLNRTVIWSDPHSGAKLQVENQFLHNTKIARSKWNESKAFEKSRQYHHPIGRTISPVEMLQQILGIAEVMSTFSFIHIATTSLEFRPTTPIELDSKGNLERPDKKDPPDALHAHSIMHVIRERMHKEDESFNRRESFNQELLYKQNWNLSTRFDALTQFGLRPVEMVELFPQIGTYYRWCHIGKGCLDIDSVQPLIKKDITQCKWVDSFGRRVLLRRKALQEVSRHLLSLTESELTKDSQQLRHHLIHIIETDSSDSIFIFDDRGERIPIPVFSSVTPRDPISFIQHIMIVLGQFETELDFKIQPTIRDSFVKTKLIGPATDEASLSRYSCDLMVRIINEILPTQPATMRRICEFVVSAKRILDNVILHDKIPITEMPPCMLTETLNKKEDELDTFWVKIRKNHLSTIYSSLPDDGSYPPQIRFESRTKENPLQWNILHSFRKSANQSDLSFDEQLFVLTHGKNAVDKYTQVLGPATTSFTKDILIHGVPGSGKTHLAQLICLYAIGRGLRVMPTSMMAARAVQIGGIHFHKLGAFHIKTNITPYRLAELSMEKLHRKSQLKYLHAMLTMDVLLFDEIYQVSATQIAALDIVLRTLRNTKIPFGGVLVIGAMDSCQFAPIGGLPFLVSSLVINTFSILELRHSVRAHSDPIFQEIQNITRMSPQKLLADKKWKKRFKKLISTNLSWAESWNDPKVTPDMMRIYARKLPVQEASDRYIDECRTRFRECNVPHVLSTAEDYQQKGRAEFTRTSDKLITGMLNKNVREPKRLLFWKGAMYYATANGKGYFHSQLMILPELPTHETIEEKSPITMFVASAGSEPIDIQKGVPTKEELVAKKWNEVEVTCAPKNIRTIQGIQAYRKQYSLVHTVASTINKQTGNTISRCAIEFTRLCHPWQKPQVVVMTSRTKEGRCTLIVGPKDYIIEQMWKIITTEDQWTVFIERMLNALSVHVTDWSSSRQDRNVFHYGEVFPLLTNQTFLPTSKTGYVYFLISTTDPTFGNVGQTVNLRRRFNQHQRGRGSKETKFAAYRPLQVAAYITGRPELNKIDRIDLERRWKKYNLDAKREGRTDIFSRIDQGQRVVNEFNVDKPLFRQANYFITIKRGTVP